MKPRPTQFDVRENTTSSRQHAPRLTVDSLPSMSEILPGRLQHRQPTRLLTSRANEPDKSIITMPLEAATGGKSGDNAETFSSSLMVITARESRQVTVAPEPFVSAQEAAQFLSVKRRYLLELARRGIAGGWPKVRTSQPPSLAQQLACEQGKSRTQDSAGNPASFKNPDDARSLHSGRQRRSSGSAGQIPESSRSIGNGAVNVVVG